MFFNVRAIVLATVAALVTLGFTTKVAAVQTASNNYCRLDYQRADNMWAGEGQPHGNLGVESISLQAGQSKAFLTDWKYEKMRNDGKTYYGSHLRVGTNTGGRVVKLRVKPDPVTVKTSHIDAGGTMFFQADLAEVSCP